VIANVLIAIHPASRRQGYGRRIAEGLVNILYTQTNTPLVYYVSLKGNAASIAIATGMGFREVETTSPTERTFIMIFER
jgi:ribosomal protein S11